MNEETFKATPGQAAQQLSLDASFRGAERSSPTPAPSFVNVFVQRNGHWFCPKCRNEVRTVELPHRCKSYGAR